MKKSIILIVALVTGGIQAQSKLDKLNQEAQSFAENARRLREQAEADAGMTPTQQKSRQAAQGGQQGANKENAQPEEASLFKKLKRNVRAFAREGQYAAGRRILNSTDCKITLSGTGMMDTEIKPGDCKYILMVGEPAITVMAWNDNKQVGKAIRINSGDADVFEITGCTKIKGYLNPMKSQIESAGYGREEAKKLKQFAKFKKDL